jgi:hypothetical protein
MWPSIFDLAIAGLGRTQEKLLFLDYDDSWVE